MNSPQYPKRAPAIQCWIKHLMEAKDSKEEKSLYTIFGKIRRARVVGTITDKRELIASQPTDGEVSYDSVSDSELRIEFDLDDGTGMIRATLWQADPEKYSGFNIGDIVDIVGLIRKWKDFVYISPEIMKKIDNPNFVLLRNAEIIKRIKSGDIETLPSKEQDFDEIEFETEKINNKEDINTEDSLKAKILNLIQKNSEKSKGTHLNDLKIDLQITEKKLKGFIRDLEYEGKIFLSDENTYLSWD